MAGTKTHDYHILPPDIWPLVGAFAALMMTSGGALAMHSIAPGKYVLLLGHALRRAIEAGCLAEHPVERHRRITQRQHRQGKGQRQQTGAAIALRDTGGGGHCGQCPIRAMVIR